MNEEGYLFGLKLKTKIYRREVVRDSDSIAGVGNGDDGYDENMIMCSICILELEDGERIADLNCNVSAWRRFFLSTIIFACESNHTLLGFPHLPSALALLPC